MSSPDLSSLPTGSMVMHLWDEESQSTKTTVIKAKREEDRVWLDILGPTSLYTLPATLPIRGCNPFKIQWIGRKRILLSRKKILRVEMCGDFQLNCKKEEGNTLCLVFTGGDPIMCGLTARFSEITVPSNITTIRAVQHWWA